MATQPAIETEALSKRYGRHRGIEDVTVGAGEVFGFLGPNGAGKMTTIRTLLDLIHPSAGEARIFGFGREVPAAGRQPAEGRAHPRHLPPA
jgi:ABC-type multidrug transport system ATPase subunit